MRRLRVNVGKWKVFIFLLERKAVKVVNFSTYSLQNEHPSSKKVLGRLRRENGGSDRASVLEDSAMQTVRYGRKRASCEG